MLTFNAALELVNSLDGVTEKEHFGGQAFSANGRIFATFWKEKKEVNVRLNKSDQIRFLEEPECFQEINNAWGRLGMTTVLLDFVSRKSFIEALRCAWEYSEEPNRRIISKLSKLKKTQNKAKKH